MRGTTKAYIDLKWKPPALSRTHIFTDERKLGCGDGVYLAFVAATSPGFSFTEAHNAPDPDTRRSARKRVVCLAPAGVVPMTRRGRARRGRLNRACPIPKRS